MANLNLAYRTTLTVAHGDADIVDAGGGLFYKEFSIAPTTVKLASTKLDVAGVAESRLPNIPEPSLTLEHRGAFVVLQGVSTLRLYWRGALQTDPEAGPEKISAQVELLDLDNIGDELLEIRYQLQRALGYLGENMLQDLIVRDKVGNITSYRLRVFASKAQAEAATKNLPDGDPREDGELARVTRTASIDLFKNDRELLVGLLTSLAATPGVS